MSPPQRVQMWPTPMKKARDSMGWEQVLPRKWGELIGGAVYVDALHLCAPHNSCRNKENKYAYKCKYLHSQVTQWPQLQFFILTASVTKHYKTEYPFYSYLWAQGLHSNDAFIFFLDVFKYEIRIKKKNLCFWQICPCRGDCSVHFVWCLRVKQAFTFTWFSLKHLLFISLLLSEVFFSWGIHTHTSFFHLCY